MKPLSITHLFIIAGVALAIGAGAGYAMGYDHGWELALKHFDQDYRQHEMTFEECVAQGYPVMESYPRQCRLPGGETFVEQIAVPPTPPPMGSGGSSGSGGCRSAGCSGQLCVSADEADGMVSTCEFRAEYACYRSARCEPQLNGQCDWTKTPELTSCLENPPAL